MVLTGNISSLYLDANGSNPFEGSWRFSVVVCTVDCRSTSTSSILVTVVSFRALGEWYAASLGDWSVAGSIPACPTFLTSL